MRREREPEHVEPAEIDGKAPPFDAEAEGAVLGAVFIDCAQLDVIAPLVSARDFYSEAHRRIWEAVTALRAANDPIDLVTVGSWLRAQNRLNQVGGMSYLTDLLNAVPVIGNAPVYARTVRRLAQARRMIVVCQQTAAVGYVNAAADVETYLATAERDITAVTHERYGREARVSMATAVERLWENLRKAVEQGRPPGISTGFVDYDDKTAGLHRGEVTIIAARPGMGKTALLLGMMRNVAATPPPLYADDGQPGQPQGAMFFSLEMPQEQLAQRLVAMEAHYQMQRLRSPHLIQHGDWSMLGQACAFLAKLPITIDDTANIHWRDLAAAVRREKAMMAKRGVRLTLVGVDYLQLMSGLDKHVHGREQEVSMISRNLKVIAKEEQVAIIAIAQLNRAVETRSGAKRPMIADLRESGSIEQDADNIVFVYRPEYYGESVLPDDEGKTELIIAKQRNGPIATAFARYRGKSVLFENF